jgi:hypothetical protein
MTSAAEIQSSIINDLKTLSINMYFQHEKDYKKIKLKIRIDY